MLEFYLFLYNKSKLESHKKVKLSIIYADLESLIKRRDECEYNSKKAIFNKNRSTYSRGYSLFMIWTLDGIKNEHDVYRHEIF